MSDPAPMNPAADKQKYIDAAKEKYQALKLVFSGGDFWIRGHSFDTVVDYFQNVDASDANSFAPTAIAGYKPIDDAWYDDFSWWGIACLKAATAPVFSAENQKHFRKIALQTWSGMEPAPFGWARCEDKAVKDEYVPLFDGGVWNHILTSKDNPGKGHDPYAARQNTVTNLGYLVLATRLYLDKGPDSPFKDAMSREYGFMEKWRGFNDPEYRLEKFLGIANPAPYVVRERVGRFKKEKVVDSAYDPKWVWAGDQGLMLGALVGRMGVITTAPEYNELLRRARKLLEGSQDYLAKDKTLHPWAPTPPDSRYQKDYWNGPAVYMRYLLWAYQHNNDLKKDLQKDSLQAFLRTNADEAEDPKRKQSGVPIVDLTNNLAILVAAIAMLK